MYVNNMYKRKYYFSQITSSGSFPEILMVLNISEESFKKRKSKYEPEINLKNFNFVLLALLIIQS
jgi:hypothetical protein